MNSLYMLLVLKHGAEAWLHVGPGAHVLVFLLGPHELGVRVLGHFRLDQIVRERRDLFQSIDEK